MNNNLLLIACHTNSKLKKNALLNNIIFFYKLCNNIVIINSIEFQDKNFENEINLKLINKNSRVLFEYIENDKYVCHGKWLNYLKNNPYNSYNNIILANDSFLITKSLNEYKMLINPDIELVALLDSYESKYHYPDFLRTYNQTGINKLLKFYEDNMININSFVQCITIYEIESSYLFENIKILFKKDTNEPINIHFDNHYLQHNLYNLNYPIIKLKKIESNYYENKELPNDFKPLEYQEINRDLIDMDESSLIHHFIHFGINEGRNYKKNQINKLPLFLEKYLFDYFFTSFLI